MNPTKNAVHPVPAAAELDPTITEVFAYYVREWCIPQKVPVKRVHGCSRHLIPFFGPRRRISTITRQDLCAFIAMRLKLGRANGTIRREMGFYFAACNFNVSEGKLFAFVKVRLPIPGEPRQRTFEDHEVQKMFATPMDLRTWYFLWLNYEGAQRSRATEQLKVGRVNMVTRLMDFRLPGVDHKKKRRGEVAISDALYPIIHEAIHRWGPPWKDDYVIGVSTVSKRMPNDHCGSTARSVNKVLVAANLKEKWVCRHVGRKTWATNAAIAGCTDIEIGTVLHDTPNTVRKHYALPKAEKMLPVMNLHKRALPARITAQPSL